MLANQGLPPVDRPTFLPPPKAKMPLGMKVALWLGALWVAGVVLVILANKFMRSLACMFDESAECRLHAANASTNVTLIGFVLLIVVSVITIVAFEMRRSKR